MVGTRMRYFFCEDKIPSLNDTMKVGAFADDKKKHYEPQLIIPNEPFSKLFTEKISPNKHSDSTESLTNALNDSKNAAASKKDEKDKKEGDKVNEKNGNAPSSPIDELESRLGTLTMVSTNDDFIMKTPFANVSTTRSDLGMVYQQWQKAQPLQAFVDVEPLEEVDLTRQLEYFESAINEYDNIVESLCQSPNNN